MDLAAYSKCRIQYRPDNPKRPDINYSDRSIIELRQYNFADYSIRAVDVDNNKLEIFNVPLRKPEQYKRGDGINQPDEIRGSSGIYFLWLFAQTIEKFHDALDVCIEQLNTISRDDSNSQSSNEDMEEEDNISEDKEIPYEMIHGKIDIPPINVVPAKELLLDIQRLNKYIQEGDEIAAVQLASQFASQHIRLQAKALNKQNDEASFTIQVQLDGDEYGIDQNGGKIPIDVFRFTKVRELRAAFEFAYQYPPNNQYFFVNGCLAHDDSTMKDLNVGPNSLFILFFLSYPRTFNRTASISASTTADSPSTVRPVSSYWECVECHSYNPSARRACKACRRLRQDLLDQCLKDSKPESTSVEPKPTRIATNHIESNSYAPTTTKPPPNWYCVICSHHNCKNDSAPTCAGCGSIFMTNVEYLNFVHEQEKQLLRYQEDSKAFQEDLRQQATAAYYKNSDEFECIICYELTGKNKGVLFHHCLHPMCKRCVLQMIETSTEPLLRCPHDDCITIIGERELRGIVKDMKRDQKIVDRLNEIGVRWAESRHKTFHCITPDCNQWWFIEQLQGNNIVYCDGCKHWICMTCVAVHEGQNCLEYQEALKIRAMNDITARKDQEHLEEMIKRREAMHCPGCQVIIQKLSGCDWLQCTQCKME
ncbi:unnamed protein product, partial [Rotaria socialis]